MTSSFEKREFLKINVCISKIYLDLFLQSRNSYWLTLFYKREYLEADRSTLSEIILLGLLHQALHPLWVFLHMFWIFPKQNLGYICIVKWCCGYIYKATFQNTQHMQNVEVTDGS